MPLMTQPFSKTDCAIEHALLATNSLPALPGLRQHIFSQLSAVISISLISFILHILSYPILHFKSCFMPKYQPHWGNAARPRTVPSGTLPACKKPRRVRRPQAAKRCGLCFAATCAWRKIPYRLQVYKLRAAGAQRVHAADSKSFVEKPAGVFRQFRPRTATVRGLAFGVKFP